MALCYNIVKEKERGIKMNGKEVKSKRNLQQNIFLILEIIATCLTFIGAMLVVFKKVDNAGYAIIPMVFSIIFSLLYQNIKNQ